MRKLIDTPNMGAASPAFPDGAIVDNAGAVIGTALTEILYGDTIQAVHKLKRLAGITENNLPDNETNGFQILTALFAQGLPTWQPTTAKVDFSKAKWVSYANGIYYHKTTASTDTVPSLDSDNWFRVFYWDGSKIVFSDETRTAGIESDISALETAVAALVAAAPAIAAHLADTTNYNNAYIDKYRPFAVGTVSLPDIAGGAPTVGQVLSVTGDFEFAQVSASVADSHTVIAIRRKAAINPLVVNKYRANISFEDMGTDDTSCLTAKFIRMPAAPIDLSRYVSVLIRETNGVVQSSQTMHLELINTY